MGGYGSGRYRWYRIKVNLDVSKRLDIRYLNQHGMLRSGNYNLTWTMRGVPVGNVDIHLVAQESMTITCKWRRELHEEWQSMELSVSLTQTSCQYGGSRYWFVCPECSRRVAVVILDCPQVACRHCLSLTYASQSENLIGRSWRKRDKYMAKLGGKDNLYLKPKGMHWKTWERLRDQYYFAEMRGWECAKDRYAFLKHVSILPES